MALSFAVKDLLWMRKFGLMLQKATDESIVRELLDVSISRDNRACITDTRNPVLSEMSKYVDLKYRFIIDKSSNGHVKLHYEPLERMVADLFTKDIAGTKFIKLVALLGLK